MMVNIFKIVYRHTGGKEEKVKKESMQMKN